ncbi:MFS general substrate transporter [Coccomyxa subellipsoidea C-169]|uniref:MFS general substrate transporter n=1 Tax=Coccomyxa subellipsoidea (strain C-169) TaxID=574566 RepID=I0YSA4_COCSC|nr:MFS general substrate transporter [Coccomyxa subellipsoidea C-169]EIE21273.1 MFS general substrate transporter [Coccomyxa subellipsoidea C-169]|eukprot:XP_005645817.1 MFS general substrate transporter [Coccomyxa subellipsoidea C-169]
MKFNGAQYQHAFVRQKRSQWFLQEPRHQITLLCFLATFTAYVERVGFSIAYTAMAKRVNVSESVKGTVLSAFYWGYGVSQVPGGFLAQRYGGRIMLMLSFLLWSAASLFTPKTAANSGAITAARVLVGVAQGFIIPSIHTWVPPHERARAVSLTTSGMYLGSAAAMLALPAVAAARGPGSLLLLNGALGLAWLSAWTIVGRDIPHRELMMPMSVGDAGRDVNARKGRQTATPWARMLRHPAVWAIVVNNFTFHYAFYVVMNWLPTYFDQVLKTNLADLGWIRTAPYLVMFATSNAGAWLGDYLITSRKASTAGARKTVNTLGFWGTAGALLLMPLAGNAAGGVLATSITLGMAGIARGGFSVNHMDIAPRHAGVFMGLSNTAGTVAGMVGVAVTGCMLEAAGTGSLLGWWQAFATSSALCMAGSLMFLTSARGDRLFGGSDQF